MTDAVSPKGEDESNKSRKKEDKPSPPDATYPSAPPHGRQDASNSAEKKWNPDKDLAESPTDAFGEISFIPRVGNIKSTKVCIQCMTNKEGLLEHSFV